MTPRSRLSIFILVTLVIVAAGLSGAHAATSSPLNSVFSFFQGFLPSTGFAAGSGGTTYTVAVTKQGDGTGIVTSGESPAKISCGATCFASYASGSSITLTATPSDDSRFASWSTGQCAGSVTPTCSFTVSYAQTVYPTFSKLVYHALTISVSNPAPAAGYIDSTYSGGFTCGTSSSPSPCTKSIRSGDTIILHPIVPAGYTFTGWGGDCASFTAGQDCSLAMNSPKSISATFIVAPSETPSVSVSHSPASPTTADTITVRADVADNLKVDAATIYVDSIAKGSCFINAPSGSCSIPLTYSAAGSHTYYAVATDTTGHTGRDPSTGTKSFSVTKSPTQTVTVQLSGSGYVSSVPGGISCGSGNTLCSATFTTDTTVTLTASPSTGYAFHSWTGCTPVVGDPKKCTLLADSPKNVQVNFVVQNTLTVKTSGTGSGTVTSNPAGIANCIGTCTANYNTGTDVILTANPATDVVATWPDCPYAPVGNTCKVTMNSAKTVNAVFTQQYPITVTRAGTAASTGTVTSSPAGISCGSGQTKCSAKFDKGSTVTLTAYAGPSSNFASWTGDCGGTATSCTIANLPSSASVTATFNTAPTDTNPPSVTSLTHSPQDPVAKQLITISASAQDNANAYTTEIYLDGIMVNSCTFPNFDSGTCAYSRSYPTTGTHNYHVKVNDSVGNKGVFPLIGEQTFTVSVPDTEPPQIGISAVPASPAVGDAVTLSAVAIDNKALKQIQVFLYPASAFTPAVPVKTCDVTGLKAGCAYTTSTLAAGTHNYYATATDTAGNKARDPATGAKSVVVGGGPTEKGLATINAITYTNGIGPAKGTLGQTIDVIMKGKFLDSVSKVQFSDSTIVATVKQGATATSLPVSISIGQATMIGNKTFILTNVVGPVESAIPFEVSPSCAAALKAFFSTPVVKPGEQVTVNIQLQNDTTRGDSAKDFLEACFGKSRQTEIRDPEKQEGLGQWEKN